MRRIILAVQIFFRTLFDASSAQQVAGLLQHEPEAAEAPPEAAPSAARPPAPPAAVQSEAITLLATLQREARFVDLVLEPLDDYSDQQIGAAARDVLRDSAKVLQRLFDLQPVVDQPEQSEVETPAPFDPGRFRLTGQVVGDPPFRGKLVHHGWEARICDLPRWSGGEASARVVAPAELELK